MSNQQGNSLNVVLVAVTAAMGSGLLVACMTKSADKDQNVGGKRSKSKGAKGRRPKRMSRQVSDSEPVVPRLNAVPPATDRAASAQMLLETPRFDGSFGPQGVNHGFYGSFGLGNQAGPPSDANVNDKLIDDVVGSVVGRRIKGRGTMADKEKALWQSAGFSMEDARRAAEETREKVSQQTPHEVLADLQRGNTRFWMGCANSPEVSAFQRRALIMSQFPRVAILGCSDSRVPTEIVFDQSLGDIFVVRVAGNVLDLAASASLEYAVHHLKVKVVIVLGHEGCGAVKAALLPLPQIQQDMPENLRDMLADIKGGLDEDRVGKLRDARAHDREAVVTNVNRAVDNLVQDTSIKTKVDQGELIICGAFYEISSGIVDFFKEVSA